MGPDPAGAAIIGVVVAMIPLFFMGRAIWRELRGWRPARQIVYEPGVEPRPRERILHPAWKWGLLCIVGVILLRFLEGYAQQLLKHFLR